MAKYEVASQTCQEDPGGAKEPEIHKREKWSRQIDYLLSCIGFSVGLGNVWRFPYLCYKNGGGGFLIPYFVCALLGGVPLFFLEASLGQFMGVGGVGTWNICPLFQGIGFACATVAFLLNIYYIVILAWAFYYTFASFTSVLPWSTCDNEWNTENCSLFLNNYAANATSSDGENVTSYGGNATSGMQDGGLNLTLILNSTTFKGVDPVTEYWENRVLGISDGIDEVGSVRWELCLCLLLAWIIVYFCVWKGIKSSGKVMYFTATSPYILMFILLVRGALLEGAGAGVLYYIKPTWERLLDIQVWVDAGTQIFYSYSIGIGTHNALGSYNKFNHNSYRDCILFALINSGTSIFAGFVIFSVLGFMAHTQQVDIANVTASGPGLAFIAYPKAVAQMPIAPLWSVLFFLMIILLGLDSQFVQLEGFITACVDAFPHQLRKGYRREIFIACICAGSFFLGITMVTNGGMYVFQLFDYFSMSRIILLVALCEVIVVAWIYGIRRYYRNLEMMYGFRLNYFMGAMWCVGSPIFCTCLFIMNAISYSTLTFDRKDKGIYTFPGWSVAVGWCMASTSVTFIPVVMIYKTYRTIKAGKYLRTLIEPEGLKPHQICLEDRVKENGFILGNNVGNNVSMGNNVGNNVNIGNNVGHHVDVGKNVGINVNIGNNFGNNVGNNVNIGNSEELIGNGKEFEPLC
ncbi:sodium- and chloride-dependent taurine transporter-like [Lineus longissimus]|uniref:sodium- and chloride-dependent taurine transporter-like n=1 Tax=Lineus longissimus TaxID=88925 RepID=UPI002B4C5FA8